MLEAIASPSSAAWIDSRLVLRDGTVATLRVTQPADHVALRGFFHDLSPESRRRRFFSLADPADTLIDAFCDSSNPIRQATVVGIVDDPLFGPLIAFGLGGIHVELLGDVRFRDAADGPRR